MTRQKKAETEKKVSKKGILIIVSVFLLASLIGGGYLLYSISLLNGIENTLRLVGSIFVILIFLFLVFLGLKCLKRRKKSILIPFLLFSIIFSIITFIAGFYIHKGYSKVNNISSNFTLYSTSIVALKENEVTKLSEIKSEKIGLLNDSNSVDGYQIPNEIIKKQKYKEDQIVKYDSYTAILKALYNKEISFAFLPTNYVIMFQTIDGYQNIKDQTKIIDTQTKKVKKETTTTPSKTNKVDKPFTLLLMGVDSEAENINDSTPNGDSLMVVTFNPNTLNATILSIPRDSYVPIMCFDNQKKNKITHAAWYGEDCMIKTIENFTGIKIDYYAKINFKGVVKLVDSLGGIDINVPYNFCEQDSNRNWGSNTVYVRKGEQTLNGEQALAFARNRHPNPEFCSAEWTDYDSNDFVRGQNQQLIVKAMMEKLKNIKSIDKIMSLLDTISNNMDTNMATNEILSFYNVGKDILLKSQGSKVDELVGIQRLYLSGYDEYIYESSMSLSLYNFVPYQGSIKDVVTAMKRNLGIETAEVTKSFTFNVDQKYEENVIGKGHYEDDDLVLLPNFVGKDISIAQTFANNNGLSIKIEYVTAPNASYRTGQIISQSYHKDMNIEDIHSAITMKVVNKVSGTTPPTDPDDGIQCDLEENKNDSACLLPNFVGKLYSNVKQYQNSLNVKIYFNFVAIKKGEEGYDASKLGQVISQDVSEGTSLFDILEKTIKITYIDPDITDTVPGTPGNE